MDTYTVIDKCRSCKSKDLVAITNLGNHYLPGFAKKKEGRTKRVPLSLLYCGKCTLVQLKHTTNPSLLWNEGYGYRSGINQTMRDHLKGIALQTMELKPLKDNDIVVDIGANDGTLLANYPKTVKVVGFDPSSNLEGHFTATMLDRQRDTYHLFMDFFNSEVYERVYLDKKASIVTAISMFYDLDDPNKFLEDVNAILDKDGLFVIQQNYLMGMFRMGAFDNICHEHLEYYSLTSLIALLDRHKLEVFDVEENDLNGGSFRTMIRKVGSKLETEGGLKRVREMLERESVLRDPVTYKVFGDQIHENIKKLRTFVNEKNREGKNIYIYGASTRGGTLLQAAGLGPTQIKAAAERNPEKYKKVMQSTNIPIVSEKVAREKADIFIVLPWFFKKEFIDREQNWIDQGGKLVFPLPVFEVIGR